MDDFQKFAWGLFPFLWVTLGIVGFFLFFFSKNVEFKKKYYPWYVISAGVLFALLMLMTGMPIFPLVIFLPVIALITYLNLRNIKFCDSCGKTIVNRAWFSKVNYCSNCGAKLEE